MVVIDGPKVWYRLVSVLFTDTVAFDTKYRYRWISNIDNSIGIADAQTPSPTPPPTSPQFTGRDLQPIFHSLSPPTHLENYEPSLSIEANIGSIMREIISSTEGDWNVASN